MPNSLFWLAAPAWLLAAGVAAAGTVTGGDVPGGIPYTWHVELAGPGDSATMAGDVGNTSWADPMNENEGSFDLDAGWTHTSNWIHLDLAADAYLTITLAPKADVSDGMGGVLAGDLVPAMSVWSGADDAGAESHAYKQGEVPAWIDDPSFAFFDYEDMGPGPFAGDAAVLTAELTAGVYTIAVGGHDEVATAHQSGYELRIVAAPEPGAPLLALAGAAVLAAARRTRKLAR